ncbi:hypothetical protein AJ80_06789 [Polytolypa hystricis UAMH7299]|uniref:DUF7708 domain-containing protein n=1 Tax=Polytolypa hystricis (strain UAMH7299) TaxID=1447883 RepID=A0A2B7XTK5_POLH7|nr:hypothetical protein AJ80_06789 [Polytolypa hystricis UAMH7299]
MALAWSRLQLNKICILEGKWEEGHACAEKLNDVDRRYLEEIQTYEAFKAKIPEIQNRIGRRSLLSNLAPFMSFLKNFLALLAISMDPTPFETTMIWGILSLAIQAASGMSTILSETIAMLDGLGRDLEILEIHERSFEDNPNMAQDPVEIFVEIIEFWTRAIHFFRRNTFGNTIIPLSRSIHSRLTIFDLTRINRHAVLATRETRL